MTFNIKVSDLRRHGLHSTFFWDGNNFYCEFKCLSLVYVWLIVVVDKREDSSSDCEEDIQPQIAFVELLMSITKLVAVS